jgi:hypothetical protein
LAAGSDAVTERDSTSDARKLGKSAPPIRGRGHSVAAMLTLGAATADITPDRPLTMVGFGQTRPFDDVARPIKARVFVLDRAGARAAIVTADLLRWSADTVGTLRCRFAEELGVPPELLLLHATHTHCAPQITSAFTPVQAAADEAYCDQLVDRVVAAGRRAADDQDPVTVSRGHSTAAFSVNRRRRRGDAIVMAPNPHGPVDPVVTALSFCRASGPDSGALKAVLVHYTCHPTTSAQNRISPDYPGTAMDRLEDELRLTAGFLQGCCGDIRPNLVEDGRFRRGDQNDVDRLAGQLADAAREAMHRAEPLSEASIAGWRERAELPFSRLPSDEELRRLLDRTDVDGRWARRLLDTSDWYAGRADLEVSMLRIADGLSLLALNAEAVVAYGAAIRERGGPSVLPLGYSNGMLGYLPTAQQLSEGGYEPVQSTRFYCLPAPLSPDAESITLAAIDRVLSAASQPGGQPPAVRSKAAS